MSTLSGRVRTGSPDSTQDPGHWTHSRDCHCHDLSPDTSLTRGRPVVLRTSESVGVERSQMDSYVIHVQRGESPSNGLKWILILLC